MSEQPRIYADGEVRTANYLHHEIAVAAYYLWENDKEMSEGEPPQSSDYYWYEAVLQLKAAGYVDNAN